MALRRGHRLLQPLAPHRPLRLQVRTASPKQHPQPLLHALSRIAARLSDGLFLRNPSIIAGLFSIGAQSYKDCSEAVLVDKNILQLYMRRSSACAGHMQVA